MLSELHPWVTLPSRSQSTAQQAAAAAAALVSAAQMVQK
jgi:hypothetical protein